MRLDKYIVDKKIVNSRNKAQSLIANGFVLVNNKIKTQVAYNVKDSDTITINQHEQYVSRGAYKLISAIDKFHVDLKNKIVLDIGSSTGGFTQVCLINGAKRVYAVDVGKNQMDQKLRHNPKIELYEGVNFKDFNTSTYKIKKINVIVIDVSFISLTKILKKIQEVFPYSLKLIVLIKPQFELGKEIIKVNHGVIKSKKLWEKAIDIVTSSAKQLGYKISKNYIESPIKGSDGNTEFLMYLEK